MTPLPRDSDAEETEDMFAVNNDDEDDEYGDADMENAIVLDDTDAPGKSCILLSLYKQKFQLLFCTIYIWYSFYYAPFALAYKLTNLYVI